MPFKVSLQSSKLIYSYSYIYQCHLYSEIFALGLVGRQLCWITKQPSVWFISIDGRFHRSLEALAVLYCTNRDRPSFTVCPHRRWHRQWQQKSAPTGISTTAAAFKFLYYSKNCLPLKDQNRPVWHRKAEKIQWRTIFHLHHENSNFCYCY